MGSRALGICQLLGNGYSPRRLSKPTYRPSGLRKEVGDRQWEGNAAATRGSFSTARESSRIPPPPLEAALDCARELGYPRLECVVLAILESYSKLKDVTTMRVAAMSPRSSLRAPWETAARKDSSSATSACSRLVAEISDEAEGCLESGEALLRGIADRVSLGVLSRAKAESNVPGGKSIPRTLSILSDAEQMARELAIEPASEFGVALTRLESLLPATESSIARPDPGLFAPLLHLARDLGPGRRTRIDFLDRIRRLRSLDRTRSSCRQAAVHLVIADLALVLVLQPCGSLLVALGNPMVSTSQSSPTGDFLSSSAFVGFGHFPHRG